MENPLPPGDDDEDEKTMMRTVPQQLSAAMAARTSGAAREAEPPRTNDASRSGAFAAAAPTKSGSFPAMVSPPALDPDEADEPEEEATRMMQSPAFPTPEDDDEDQATIMRTSMTPEEVERLQSIGGMPPPTGALPAADAPPPAEHENFAATVALDALGLAPPPAEPPPAPPFDANAQNTGLPAHAGAPPNAPAQAPLGNFAAGLAALGPAGSAPIAPAPRRGPAIWIALILVLAIAAGATFYFLHLRF